MTAARTNSPSFAGSGLLASLQNFSIAYSSLPREAVTKITIRFFSFIF